MCVTGTFLYYIYFSFEVLLFRTWKCSDSSVSQEERGRNHSLFPSFLLEWGWAWPRPQSSPSLE